MTTENISLYERAKQAYYAGEPIITDDEFDALEKALKGTIESTVGAPERSGKVLLPVPMGSLDQLHNSDELSRWVSTVPANTRVLITEKLDGNSCMLDYNKTTLIGSYSRGDGIEGANNLRHLQHFSIPKTIPVPTSVRIRGEVIVSKLSWATSIQPTATNRAGKQYANSRNFVAGFLNSKVGTPELYQHIDFIAYEVIGLNMSKSEQLSWLSSIGFNIPKMVAHNLTNMKYVDFEDVTRTMINESEYELDGIVIDVNDRGLRDSQVDLNNLNPSHARKLKLINDASSAITIVRSVEWNVSKDGFVKPLVHFDSIELDGAMISKATGHNARNVRDMGIGPGAVIRVVRSGMVIPKIVETIDPGVFEQPVDCEWNETGADLIVSTDGSSGDIKQRRLEHFFSTIEVDHMGEGNVTRLIASGEVNTPVDAVLLTNAKYALILGENGRKAAVSLRTKLSNIEPAVLFSSVGVLGRGVGVRKIRSLIESVGIDVFLAGNLTIAEISSIDGFDVTTAGKIVTGTVELISIVNTMVKNGITLASPSRKVADGVYSGQLFCPTGVRFTPEMVLSIQKAGGIIADTLSSKVTTLVAKDPNSSSSKIDKARSRGVRIMSLYDFQQELNTL